jgi:hypothetical protein
MTTEQDWATNRAEFLAFAGKADVDDEPPANGSGPSPLAVEFARLTRTLLSAGTVAEVLEQVVHAAHQVVPGADLVSITLRAPDGTFHTPVETDPLASKLDQVQYDTGEGPCVTAAELTGPAYIHSEHLATEPAWPRFGPAAADHGFSAVLSTALLADTRPPQLTGALNIYSRRGGALDTRARDTALLLATHASLALAGIEAVELATLRETHLRRAMQSRDVIGQAKGILMHRRGISAEEAFDLLRHTSQDLNIKLVELATTLAARHTQLDPPAD